MKKLIIFFLTFTSFTYSSNVLEQFSKGKNPEFILAYDGHEQLKNLLTIDLVSRFFESPIVIEAGGHEGEDTIRFANAWPLGKIISFEPNPRALNVLRQITSHLPNVYSYPFALDETEHFTTFYLCQGPNKDTKVEGASSLLESSKYMHHHYQGDKIEVQCVRLDDWCHANGVDHVDFIWFDLEGKELDAFKGAQEILKTVSIIYTETNFQPFRKGMCQFTDLKEYLESQGFEMIQHWFLKDWQGNAVFVKKELVNSILDSVK